MFERESAPRVLTPEFEETIHLQAMRILEELGTDVLHDGVVAQLAGPPLGVTSQRATSVTRCSPTSMRRSPSSISTSPSSGSNGATTTWANAVWRRCAESKGDWRTSRWTPRSAL